jgi:hypothetical protein
VNERPETINTAIRAAFGWRENETIEWLSPLRADGFAEYYDESFIERLRPQICRVPWRAFGQQAARDGMAWHALEIASC